MQSIASVLERSEPIPKDWNEAAQMKPNIDDLIKARDEDETDPKRIREEVTRKLYEEHHDQLGKRIARVKASDPDLNQDDIDEIRSTFEASLRRKHSAYIKAETLRSLDLHQITKTKADSIGRIILALEDLEWSPHDFWERLRASWDTEQLDRAIFHFEKTGDVSPFRYLRPPRSLGSTR
ncbi:hypothetical protein HYV73_00600 [Candidatus Uhrbacteria bacterium]|nr:hypothetical protein [Candidatus Uhrbacteria bacterium]